jgi:thiol-disulfide isomerase/thioredoxin
MAMSKTMVAVTAWVLSAAAWAVQPGEMAPDIPLTGAQGAAKLSDLKGSVVYLDFWASWCGPCKQSFPWMNEMQAKYGAKGLKIVGMNLDAKKEDADKFLSQVPAKFTVAFDSKGESPKLYKIKGMPSSVLIDAQGKVIAVHSGFKEEEAKELEANIQKALGTK